MIYVLITLTSFLIEIFVWWLSRESKVRSWVRKQSAGDFLTKVTSMTSNARLRVNRQESNTWATGSELKIPGIFGALFDLSAKDKVTLLILQPIDIIATIWLSYIVFAQTFGSYQNCECMSSTWGTNGVSSFLSTKNTC